MRVLLDEMSRSYDALVEGADPADMDHCDGIWRSNPDADRAAAWATEHDHITTLLTGGRLNDSVLD